MRGHGAAVRTDVCWVPIAAGLTPHGLRHTYKTLMIELRTPAGLMDAQMGHADGSVQALYSHVTDGMIRDLLDGLTGLWEQALVQRRLLSPRSPVAVLDRLLIGGEERPRGRTQDRLQNLSRSCSSTGNGLRPGGTKPVLTC